MAVPNDRLVAAAAEAFSTAARIVEPRRRAPSGVNRQNRAHRPIHWPAIAAGH
jgi:hypothetical protein